MKAYTLASWRALSDYPGLADIALNRAPTKTTTELGHYARRILENAGFERAAARRAAAVYHAYVFGF